MNRGSPVPKKPWLSNIGPDPADHPYDDDTDQRIIRDVHLIISRSSLNSPFCFVLTQPKQARPALMASPPHLDPDYVNDRVQDCFAVWQRTLLEYEDETASPGGTENARPFCDGWNLCDRDQTWLRKRLGPLAVAGQDLFHLLFREQGDAKFNRIADRLEELSCSGNLHVTIESDQFFVPWRMIYIHPDPRSPLHELNGDNYDPRGFWGYSHIIEHIPHELDMDPRIHAESDGCLCGSVNYDAKIDSELRVECIKPHLRNIGAMPRWAKQALRSEKSQLIAAISDAQFREQIIYFFCHGQGWGDPDERQRSIAHVMLTDGEPIRCSDILSRRKSPFKPSPLVFINACQGGQVTRYFYEALVAAFLVKRHALSVIGPQIDIPALFAAEFAERFFKRLLNEDPAPHIAELIRDLTREFFDEHQDPLGLVYSVYRGIDCYIER